MTIKEKTVFRILPLVIAIFAVIIVLLALFAYMSNMGISQNPDYDSKELVNLLVSENQYDGLKKVNELIANGTELPDVVLNLAEQSADAFYDTQTAVVSELIRQGDFTSASDTITKLEEFFPDDPKIKNLRFSVLNTVEYNGVIEHIFFHPLIVYPERAFPASGRETGQDLYMVTVYEFKKIIDELYANNYILVRIEDLFDVSYDETGAVTSVSRRSLFLPAGKKPLVLSVDDINYYEYMIRDGQNFKLILDYDGNLCTYSKDMDGNEIISYDNEIMTIVDSFVDAHPDFSFNYAKGVLGVTGYEGVLGWRVNDRPEKVANYEEEAAGLRKVVAKLKEKGWTFASHSQGHRNTPTASLETIMEDTDRWDEIVKPFVGATPVYIYPYGAGVKQTDDKFKDFQKHGFGIFCTVQMAPLLKVQDSSVVMGRKNIDGIAFNGHGLDHMMNVDAVIDPVRPNVTRKSKKQ